MTQTETRPPAAPREHEPQRGIFPTFFMSGFECSTFVWKDGQRKDYLALTGHDRHLAADCDRLQDAGIGVAREAIRWPLVDRGGGRYDWSTLDAVMEATQRCHVTPIWDMCHYGFPDDCDPFGEECLKRFEAYCHAAATRITERSSGVRFYTPINEITFFSAAATDMGWMYPFAKGRYAEMKQALCRMSIAGVRAIRAVDPSARMVHVDPLIYEVPPADRPDLADEAWHQTYQQAFEAWDMLYGTLHPELGGAPEILDIVGVNVYNFCQAQINADGSREVLGPRDPRRKPLSEMLQFAWERYHRPIIIGETSGFGDTRAEWLRMVMEESLRALLAGVDLQGVCLFPFVDMPDWQSGEWAKIGTFDVADGEEYRRVPCEPYIQELRRWQQALDQPENIEPDAYGSGWGRVQLDEVRRYAERWAAGQPDHHEAEDRNHAGMGARGSV